MVSAQNEGAYRYADATQLWRTTGNAAGLSLDSSANRGMAAFTLQHKSGDYHRVQEGGQQNLMRFEAERYQTVGRYLTGYGRFSFDMDRTKDRSWADVYRPYDGSPYFSGSDVPGKYDQQSFDFTGALATTAVGRFRFGLRLDYKVGDLSRLRDPRSRSQLLDYKLSPSVVFTMGRHAVGLAPYYQRRKEKMPTPTTVQNDPNLGYYEMRGLEQVYGAVGFYKGFNRQWVDHRIGGVLNYAYRNETLHSLTTIGLGKSEEDILEKEKREPAHYAARSFSLASRNRIVSGRLLHELDLQMDFQKAYGDEYMQQRIQTTDEVTGVSSYHYETVIAYEKRYQARRLDGMARYRLNFASQQSLMAYLGTEFQLQGLRQKHVLPTSTFDHQRFALTLEGGKALLSQRLWVDVSCGYHFTDTGDDDLCLAEPSSVYAQKVLLPDMDYYKANYWRAHLQLTYEFPLLVKGRETRWFVRAYGDCLHTDNSFSRRCVGLTVGLLN
jgi:hypothetical protein